MTKTAPGAPHASRLRRSRTCRGSGTLCPFAVKARNGASIPGRPEESTPPTRMPPPGTTSAAARLPPSRQRPGERRQPADDSAWSAAATRTRAMQSQGTCPRAMALPVSTRASAVNACTGASNSTSPASRGSEPVSTRATAVSRRDAGVVCRRACHNTAAPNTTPAKCIERVHRRQRLGAGLSAKANGDCGHFVGQRSVPDVPAGFWKGIGQLVEDEMPVSAKGRRRRQEERADDGGAANP